MLVKIVSYKPYSQCYAWYKNLVGKTVNVKEKLPHQEDYIIDDPEIIIVAQYGIAQFTSLIL